MRKVVLTLLLVILYISVFVFLFSFSNYAGQVPWKTNKQISEQECMSKNKPLNKAHISGKVIHKSDVMTIPDNPYSSGLVLAVPSESLASLLDHTKAHDLESTELTKELFSNYVVSSVTLEEDGYYSLYLKPGGYSLCACNLGASHPDPKAFPIYIYSCLEIVVKGGEKRSVDIFFGMGGIHKR